MLGNLLTLAEATSFNTMRVEDFVAFAQTYNNFQLIQTMSGQTIFAGWDERGVYITQDDKYREENRYYDPVELLERLNQNALKCALIVLKEFHQELEDTLPMEGVIQLKLFYDPDSDDRSKLYILSVDNIVDDDARKKTYNYLKKELDGQKLTITCNMVGSQDGETVETEQLTTRWELSFGEQVEVNSKAKKDVAKEINKLKAYLDEANKVASEILEKPMTNFDLTQLNLGKVEKAQREQLKTEREKIVNNLLLNFKLQLGDVLRKLAAKNKSLNFVDLTTGLSYDIPPVDMDALLQLNLETRYKVTNLIKTLDPLSDMSKRGGLMGEMFIRISSIFGMPELAKPSNVQKLFQRFDSGGYEGTIEKFSSSLTNLSPMGVRRKITSIIDDTQQKLQQVLANYQEQAGKLQDKDLNSTTDQRTSETLLVFAHSNERLNTLRVNLGTCESIADIIHIIYGGEVRKLYGEPTA